MRVRAKGWIKHNGAWAMPGEVFETDNPAALSGLVEEVSDDRPQQKPEFVGPSAEVVQPIPTEAPNSAGKKSGKKKKPA